MAEQILQEIRERIALLKDHKRIQKVIFDVNDVYPEIGPQVKEAYYQRTGQRTANIGSRFNPDLIAIIEEMGEAAKPLYLKEVEVMPGQDVRLEPNLGTGEEEIVTL